MYMVHQALRPESDRMDSWLTPQQAATGLAFRKMVEGSLYWTALIHTRYHYYYYYYYYYYYHSGDHYFYWS